MKYRIAAMAITLALATGGAAFAFTPPSPSKPETQTLNAVQVTFIVAGERTFLLNQETQVLDRQGNPIPLFQLTPGERVEIEYFFRERDNKPVALRIQRK